MRKKNDVRPSEITSETVYQDRRKFLQKSCQYAFAGLGLALVGCSDDSGANPAISTEKPSVQGYQDIPQPSAPQWLQDKVASYQSSDPSSAFRTDEKLTPYKDVTGYNNFYEFGYGKEDPARYAQNLKTDPWSVTIEGEVERPGTYTLEDILKPQSVEEKDLPAPLCRSLVDGHSLGRLLPSGPAQALSADF